MKKTKISNILYYAILCGTILTVDNASASCGSSSCFLNAGSREGVFAPRQVLLDLSYQYIPQDKKLRGSTDTSEVLVPKIDFENGEIEPEHHRELRTLNTLARLDVIAGITPRLTLAVELPFYNDRLHEHDDGISDAGHGTGQHGEFTNNDGASGFGDVRVMARYAFHASTRHLFVVNGGTKFPTGEYKLRNGDGNINEPTIMPGTGSYDFFLGGYYRYQWQPGSLQSDISLRYRMNTENDIDYRFGNTATLNLGTNYRIADKLVLSVQLNTRYSRRDKFKGQGVPSTGHTMIYLTPGVQIESRDNISFYTHLQLPVYQHVNESNIVPSYGFIFGITRSL